jgi:glycosyltransferase involved in cell wall biosynthesis
MMVQNQALTIHDLSPLAHPEWFRASFSSWYRLFLPILARRVKKVFTPSEYVKRKLIQRFGIQNVTVTPNGVDRSVFHPNAKQTTFDLPECYVLFVGTLEPRKNLDILLRSWNEIKDDFRETWLIIVGVSRSVFRSIHLSHDVERVRFLGYVEDRILAGLYTEATLVVLPSQDEGFGLPALEAMASGTPVIVSDGGALPEVVGDAGLIFKLTCYPQEKAPRIRNDGSRHAVTERDTAQLSNTLIQCLTNAQLRSELTEKGLARAQEFSWQTTAELVWKNLNES